MAMDFIHSITLEEIPGLLDTTENVRELRVQLEEVTDDQFRQLEKSRQQSWAEAEKSIFD
jgi:hypothetical protein